MIDPPKKMNMSLKRDHFKRKIVFQSSFFRGHDGHVRFRGSKLLVVRLVEKYVT